MISLPSYFPRGAKTSILILSFFFNDTATTEIYTLSLHDALPISTAYTRAATASADRDATATAPRRRAARGVAGAARGRGPHPTPNHRRARARRRDRDAHTPAGAAAARPARCWAARRRADPDLLIAPRPDQRRSRVRATRRLRPDPSLVGTNDPLPPRPRRRPPTQPSTAHDPRHQTPRAPADDRLHQPSHPRRQESLRSKPLPQALPRPQPLPAAREPTAYDLTNIEASLAQARSLCPRPSLCVMPDMECWKAWSGGTALSGQERHIARGASQTYWRKDSVSRVFRGGSPR